MAAAAAAALRPEAALAWAGVAGAAFASACGFALAAARQASRAAPPEVVVGRDEAWNAAVLARCPRFREAYVPHALFALNEHVETVLPSFWRLFPHTHVTYERQTVTNHADGGTASLDWVAEGKALPPDAPLLFVLSGLGGGSGDAYVGHLMAEATHRGYRCVAFTCRGCDGEPLKTPQFYSASFTGDVRLAAAIATQAHPEASVAFAAGYSLGANILLKYCAEEGEAVPFDAAVSLCNPFDLDRSMQHIRKGFSAVYNRKLGASMAEKMRDNEVIFRQQADTFGLANGGASAPADVDGALASSSIYDFDEAITRRCFGFDSVKHYYDSSSSARALHKVTVPVLAINATDDPIADVGGAPRETVANEMERCHLVLTPAGGHLGWVAACNGAAGRGASDGAAIGAPWTDCAVLDWLKAVELRLTQERLEEIRVTSEEEIRGLEQRHNGLGLQQQQEVSTTA